jgi:hypothetical protein
MKTSIMWMAGAGLVAAVVNAVAATNYIAVCTEKREHDGKEIVLAVRDNFDAANEAGKAHERATRGHRWRMITQEVRSDNRAR